jgi:predicted SnoaL-like aldol condensation-catalyzing enzyme
MRFSHEAEMMFSKAGIGMRWFAGLIAFLALMAAPVRAQSKQMTAQEQANLKLVMDWWREVVFAHHVDLAQKYMAGDFVQHDPNFPNGLAAFVEILGKRPAQAIPAALTHPPVKAFAKGNYVALVWEHEDPDPADRSKTYKFNTFDVVRVQDGKIQEHWDSSMKNPGAATLAPASAPPIAQDLKLTPEEHKNQEIAFVEFHDMLQYGHLELAEQYIAPGYIQHNPNVPTGRDGFVQYMSRVRKPEPIQPEWKTKPSLVITSGDLVLMMFDRSAPDPDDPSRKYSYNNFDMVRVENGQVQEHWDAAKKNPPAPPKP